MCVRMKDNVRQDMYLYPLGLHAEHKSSTSPVRWDLDAVHESDSLREDDREGDLLPTDVGMPRDMSRSEILKGQDS